ncbi:hypothetical protein ACS8E2_07270 [Psychrobacter glaciei]|uniref:hypothetical protein n=1 Tax=Psychrobacter glaciei TaxID=619771 RepID=UPI003F483023
MKITKKRLFDFCNENNDALNELQSQSDSTGFVLSTLIEQLKDLGVIDKLGDEPSDIEKVELTGSDLTAQIMIGQRYQAAFVSDKSEDDALKHKRTALIDNVYKNGINERFRAGLTGWIYAIPINNQGEPLTATDVGL